MEIELVRAKLGRDPGCGMPVFTSSRHMSEIRTADLPLGLIKYSAFHIDVRTARSGRRISRQEFQ